MTLINQSFKICDLHWFISWRIVHCKVLWWSLFFKNSIYWQVLCIIDDILIYSRNHLVGYYWLLIHVCKQTKKSLYSVIFCFLKSAFIFNLHAYVWCVFMSVCYMNTYVDAVSQWSIDSLELNLQTLVNWLIWVLGSHLCCSIGVHTSLTAESISDLMFANSIKYNLQFLEAFFL